MLLRTECPTCIIISRYKYKSQKICHSLLMFRNIICNYIPKLDGIFTWFSTQIKGFVSLYKVPFETVDIKKLLLVSHLCGLKASITYFISGENLNLGEQKVCFIRHRFWTWGYLTEARRTNYLASQRPDLALPSHTFSSEHLAWLH